MRRILFLLLVLCLLTPARGQDEKLPDRPLKSAKKAVGRVAGRLNTGGHATPIVGLAFTPDGSKLITADYSEVHVWSTAASTRERVWRLPLQLDAIAVAPDGKTVAVPSLRWDDKERYTILWLLDLDTGASRTLRLPIAYHISSLAFSPDSRRLAWSTWYQSGVCNVRTGRVMLLPKPGTPPGRVAFSKNGQHLLDCWPVGEKARAQVYDVTRLTPKVPLRREDALFELKGASLLTAAAPDGSRFADWDRTSGVAIRVWNAQGRRERAADGTFRIIALRGPMEPHHLQFLDPQRLAVVRLAPEQVRVAVVNVDKGEVVRPGRSWTLPESKERLTALSADGNFLAVTSGPGYRVQLFDLRGNKELPPLGVAFPIPTKVAWSPDSRSIGWQLGADASAGLDGGLNLATLEPQRGTQLRGFKGFRAAPGWSLHHEAQTRRARKTRGLTLIHNRKRIETDLDSPPAAYTFYTTAAGKQGLAVISQWRDGDLHLINTETGGLTLVANATHGTDVAVSPDGRFLLLSRWNQALDLYGIDGKPALVLKVLVAGQDWVAWTPRGYFAATPGGERMMGWTSKMDDRAPLTFYTAEQFRKVLYRPDVVKLIQEKGSLAAAVQAANALRVTQRTAVPRGEADPEKLLPPGVTLSIVDQKLLPKITVKVSARESCAEQPIKSLRLLVDGRPLPNRQAFVEFSEGKEHKIYQETWTVDLPPGKHQLSMLARSKDDTPNVSNAIEVACPLPSDQRPKLHHVAIGINTYDKVPKLKCAAPDAQRLSRALQAKNSLYNPGVSEQLLDQSATRAAVVQAIEAVRQAAKPNDLFVFSFAGHGVREEGEFYLLTREADSTNARTLDRTALSGAALREKLADFPCQVLLLLDACYAGAFGAAGNLKPASEDAARALADVDVRVAVLCAALGHEEAQEKEGHGLFTNSIVRALGKAPNVFFDTRTGEMNVYHLQAFVYQEVAHESAYKQTPYLKMPLGQPPFVVTQFK